MLFSIVITTYNRPAQLTRCLQFASNQTYEEEYEVIVVNDGSTIIYPHSIQDTFSQALFYEITNQGVSSARNFGVQKARGEYICFCDDDDILLPNHLEILCGAIELQTDKNFILHTLPFLMRDKWEIKRRRVKPIKLNQHPADYLLSGDSLCVICCTCMPRFLVEQHPFPQGVKYAEDTEQRTMCLLKNRLVSVNKYSAIVDLSGPSATHGDDLLISRAYIERYTLLFEQEAFQKSITKETMNKMLAWWYAHLIRTSNHRLPCSELFSLSQIFLKLNNPYSKERSLLFLKRSLTSLFFIFQSILRNRLIARKKSW